jgi:hypothetical protein
MQYIKFVPVKGGGIARITYDPDTDSFTEAVFNMTDREVANLLNSIVDSRDIRLMEEKEG